MNTFHFRWLVQFTHASIYRCSQTPLNAAPKPRRASHIRESLKCRPLCEHVARTHAFSSWKIRFPNLPRHTCVSQASLASSYNSSPCRLLRPLHLAHGYHLLPQVVLVLANTTIPPSDCLVLTNQDIFRNLIEQSAGMSANSIDLVEVIVNLPEVVRDHDNTARKCING